MELKNYIANIEDFPKKGILFRDITPLILDGEAFSYACNEIYKFAKGLDVDVIVGPEARGFIFGCPLANMLKKGFVPVRKAGKLPREKISTNYSLEYNESELAIHKDSIQKGQRVIIVDDLLATGGTIKAGINLVEQLGGIVVGIVCLIELEELNGRDFIGDYNIHTLVKYDE